MPCMLAIRRMLCWFILSLFSLACLAEDVQFPAEYVTTTSLNVRASNNTQASKITTLPAGSRVQVQFITANQWAAIEHNGKIRYVSAKYIRPIETTKSKAPATSTPATSTPKSKSFLSQLLDLAISIALLIISWLIFRSMALFVLNTFSRLMYWACMVLCLPFYISNWLQRFLAKPWRILYKTNSGNDRRNAELRETYQWVKIPLYIALTPLRFVNAVYYNMVVHCTFEAYNYMLEVFLPSNEKEGEDDIFRLILYLPARIAKYVVWHGGLTVLESGIWTVVDTFIPALTLYHGTDERASTTITHAGRDGYSCRLTGIWNVGKGNFAGNGIYFAPVRSTAMHYAVDAMIVCRVSLGKTIDLGLAPYWVYKQCGHPDAFGATDWGLRHGYVTGEWWRKDTGWWEYCMYDWKNRYNYSWRIRPLYVLNFRDRKMQRIPGGMCHWLFRQLVFDDIMTSIEEAID